MIVLRLLERLCRILGDAGGEMGYTNVVAGTPPLFGNSMGFEFDTYANLGETSSNEISVHANGTGPNQWQESYSIGRASPSFALADGVPNPGDAFPTPYGTLCFLPELLFLASPLCFTLTDNFGLGLTTLIPSSPAPWSFAQRTGVPLPIVLTLQGLMYTGVVGANYAVTNAVTLDVHP